MSFRALFATLDPAITSTLGDAVSYIKPSTGHVSTVNGIFQRAYAEIFGIEGTRPMFTATVVDIPQAQHGDRIVYDGITYEVMSVQPTGTDLVVLLLEDQR